MNLFRVLYAGISKTGAEGKTTLACHIGTADIAVPSQRSRVCGFCIATNIRPFRISWVGNGWSIIVIGIAGCDGRIWTAARHEHSYIHDQIWPEKENEIAANQVMPAVVTDCEIL
jgi:hypothetical protein